MKNTEQTNTKQLCCRVRIAQNMKKAVEKSRNDNRKLYLKTLSQVKMRGNSENNSVELCAYNAITNFQ